MIQFPHKQLSSIGTALLGKKVGRVTLRINQGGLTNRDAPQWVKNLFKAEVLPWLTQGRYPAEIVTGLINLNISDSVIASLSFGNNWFLKTQLGTQI